MTTSVRYHDCGGAILSATHDGQPYRYCDRCGAFVYVVTLGPMPTGTDKRANQAAWDDGEDCSPDAPAQAEQAAS